MSKVEFIFFTTLVIYLFLETEAFPKWAELLKLKFLKYQEFKQFQNIFPQTSYPIFLKTKYPNFATSLVSCQECLCVWFNIIGFIFMSESFGGWSKFGPVTIFSLLSIALFKKAIKKLYE